MIYNIPCIINHIVTVKVLYFKELLEILYSDKNNYDYFSNRGIHGTFNVDIENDFSIF